MTDEIKARNARAFGVTAGERDRIIAARNRQIEAFAEASRESIRAENKAWAEAEADDWDTGAPEPERPTGYVVEIMRVAIDGPRPTTLLGPYLTRAEAEEEARETRSTQQELAGKDPRAYWVDHDRQRRPSEGSIEVIPLYKGWFVPTGTVVESPRTCDLCGDPLSGMMPIHWHTRP